MCDITDAKRQLELAKTAHQNNNIVKAIQHYLEASSIYLLQHQYTNDPHLLEHAQEYYNYAQKLQGKEHTTSLTKEELAHRTLHELHNEPDHCKPDILTKIKELVN